MQQPSELITAVVAAVQEVPGVDTVLAYEPVPEGVTTVTAWVDLESMIQTAEANDDHWSAEATIRITVAIPQDADTRIAAWDLGWAIAFHLRHQRWGLKTEPAQIIGLERPVLEDYEGDLDAVEIEIAQMVYLRESPIAPGPDATVWAGISPNVGPEHIDDYFEVSG